MHYNQGLESFGTLNQQEELSGELFKKRAVHKIRIEEIPRKLYLKDDFKIRHRKI